jgi:zinc transport system substrate-binding protein
MVGLRVLLLSAFTLFSSSTWAITVLTTVKPIQMLTYELVNGVGSTEVLLENNASPHDYALRPSDLKKINSADVIVWFGEGLEPFMSKIMDQQNQEKIITVSQLNDVPLRHFDETHHDDGHNHGNEDPHFWLGSSAAKAVARHISQKLSAIDSRHAEQYQANLNKFLANLAETEQQISVKLQPFQTSPYYVFHDAYGYFENQYGLNKLGFFTVSPERKPGAKTLISIRKALSAEENICVFAEPQFKPAVIDSVTRGTSAKIGILDPLATDIKVESGSYMVFLNSLADSFANCFKAE